MSNLAQRLITGSIFVVVLVGCIWWSPWTLALLCLLVTILGLNEFYTLALKANSEPQKEFGIILGAIIVIAGFASKAVQAYIFLPVLVPLVFLPFFVELGRKKTTPFANIGWTLLGLIYVALPMMILVLTFTPNGYLLDHSDNYFQDGKYEFLPALMMFVLIWVSDSMAYVCGRLFGKHKLWERISPKKTWEGFIGGLLFTVATGAGIAHWSIDNPDFSDEITWGVVGFVISWTGMLGDLVESMLKRSIDVKDSGTILPGHGGILDRFDALFLSVPFAVTTYWIMGHILR